AFVSSLNCVRNNFKHAGMLPHVPDWYRVISNTETWVAEWCDVYLGADFATLDFSDLLANEEIRRLYGEAKRASAARDYKGALEFIGRALLNVLHSFPGMVFPVVGK